MRVLVLLASATRRGAELEGQMLASTLDRHAQIEARSAALAPARAGDPLEVGVLGPSAMSPRTLRELRRRAADLDVVLAFGSTTLQACAIALLGCRARFVYRSIGDPQHWVRGRLHRARTGLLMRRAEHVVALWSGAESALIELYGLDPSRTSVIPNARSRSGFSPPSPLDRARAREALGLDAVQKVIAYIGALAPEKRVDRAIAAASRIEGATLVVVGDGPERHRLEAIARRDRSDRVRFTGTSSDPGSVLRASDALVLTSATEGMPGAAIEALLCGIPVVAPSVGALPEMIEDGVSGRLTGEGSVEATAAALEEVTAEGFGAGWRARASAMQEFDLDTVTSRWADLLMSVAR